MMTGNTEVGIQRRYLHDEVADRLRELIRSGQLKPHQHINELELCARFGISRTPMREAIKILATEGLLELLPNRGAHVTSVSQDELDEIMEVIAGIEATAGDLACRNASEGEIDAIAAMTDEMLATFDRRDEAGFFAINWRIHEAIVRAAHNSRLTALYATFTVRIQHMRYSAGRTSTQWQRAADEHRRMVALLRARDCETLCRLMRDHARASKPVILATYGDEHERG
ncbi:MAG: GntR family transcriptional regulator [Proteobacteria bacterium]|nr:GntR family transcriptional regulator [Pseudomonadota bacterium]